MYKLVLGEGGQHVQICDGISQFDGSSEEVQKGLPGFLLLRGVIRFFLQGKPVDILLDFVQNG